MLRIINPATEELFNEIEETSISDLTFMFENSQKAQKKWRSSLCDERRNILLNFKNHLLEEKESCAKILSQEMGKPVHQAVSEIKATAVRVQWFIDHFEECLETKTVYSQSGVTEKISWDPLGIVLNISAWNFPYFIGSNVFVPALLTGNSVIYKPSEICPSTGLKIRELLIKSGLDKDLFQVVIGGGSVGQTLLEYPVDGVFFTGSYATGQTISKAISGHLIKSTMELGGKDPAYVCEDASFDDTVSNLVDGVFYNAGQSCCSVERIYVHESIYDRFLEVFSSKTKELIVGDPLDSKTYMGPLARYDQIAFLNQQIKEARDAGAYELVKGGVQEGQSGWFYRPCVLSEVDHTMSLIKEESFGPVIGIMKVKDDEEALSLMNDTQYGLTASVHTNDYKRAEKIMKQINAGTVYLNFCDRVSPYVPWSGRKSSGMGSTLSSIGIKEFIRPKAWQVKLY